MKQGTKRFISIVISLMLLTAAAVVYFSFIKEEYVVTLQLRGERDRRTQFVEQQQKNIESIKQKLATFNSQSGSRHAVTVAVPLNPDTAGIIAQVNALAATYRLELQSFVVSNAAAQTAGVKATSAPTRSAPSTNSPESLKKPIVPVTFQVKFVGSYNDFKGFIQSIEENLRIMDVKSVTVIPANGSDRDLYTVDVTITAYYTGT
jgi:Tfp pilus assembly protein PilO